MKASARLLLLLSTAALASGCAEALALVAREPLNSGRRTRVSVGLGSATLNPGGTAEDEDQEAQPPELGAALSLHATVVRRLASPAVPVALSAGVVAHAVTSAPLRGVASEGCRVRWWSAGPAIVVDAPAAYPVWVSADVSVNAARLARSGCSLTSSGPESDAALRLSPAIGFALNFGLTERVGWNFGGRWVRLPLDSVGLASQPRWGGAGALSVVIAF